MAEIPTHKIGQYWRYAFGRPVSGPDLEIVYFYDFSEEGARKQFEEAFGTPAEKLLERVTW